MPQILHLMFEWWLIKLILIFFLLETELLDS
jgi:hypothetical protein